MFDVTTINIEHPRYQWPPWSKTNHRRGV